MGCNELCQPTGGRAMQDILVLIVEDEALVRLELEGALHDGGYATELKQAARRQLGSWRRTRQSAPLYGYQPDWRKNRMGRCPPRS